MNMKQLIFVNIVLVLIIIYLLVTFKLNKEDIKTNQIQSEEKDIYDLENEWIEEFKKIGSKYGTDKIYHGYHKIYGRYLGPLKNKKLNFFEIGIGCGMPYGAGKSILTWKEFLPNSKISVLEYDKNCAEKFRSQVFRLYTGDQSNFDKLNEVAQTGPFDVIIDDGGHSRKQQINSLIGLFPHVKSGGIYVMEDIYNSFITKPSDLNDYPISSFDFIKELLMLFNNPKPINHGRDTSDYNHTFSEEVKKINQNLEFINCFNHACVFKKM